MPQRCAKRAKLTVQPTDRARPEDYRSTSAFPASAEGCKIDTSVSPRDDFIFLNVGGKQFVTTLTTLQADPNSHLAKWFTDPSKSLPKDPAGNFFIDRDGQIFRYILNFLRGYSFDIDPRLIPSLIADLEFYGIRRVEDLLGIGMTTPKRFMSGPGVSEDGRAVKSSFAVAVCGNRWLTKGEHVQTFRVVRSEFVGIGVVSPQCLDYGADFGSTANCAAYYMNGAIRHNFGGVYSAEAENGFSNGDKVAVNVDFNSGIVAWAKNDVKVASCEFNNTLEGLSFRFAVVLQLASTVTIEQPPES